MTEATRVSTFKLAFDVSSAVYPASGVTTPFHAASHHGENPQSIAEFAKLSTQEATRTEQNPQLLKLSLEGLNSSVQGFEQSHPRLVQIVGAVTNTLSNLGI